MNALTNLAEVLETGRNEIHVDPMIGKQAVVCIDRMLDFSAREKAAVRPQGDLAANAQLFQGIGPA